MGPNPTRPHRLSSRPFQRLWPVCRTTLAACRPGQLAIITLLLCLLIGSGAADAAQESVLRSDDSGVRFSLSDLQATWSTHTVRNGQLQLHEARIAGFSNGGLAGQARLPRRSGWIVVPPGMRPEIVVVSEQWAPVEPLPLQVVPTPVMLRDAETGEVVLGSELLLPGESPRTGRPVPAEADRDKESGRPVALDGPAVNLGETELWRGRRIVPYTISPLQADADGRATRLLRSGTWEVRFVADSNQQRPDTPAAQRSKRTKHGDDRFGAMFLNGGMLSRWTTEGAAGRLDQAAPATTPLRASAAEPVQLLAPEIKLPVSRTRLYRVTASGLAGANLLPGSGIQEDQIRLYQRRFVDGMVGSSGRPYIEIEVPIYMVGEGDAFSGDDFFLFYGLRPRDDGEFTADLGNGVVTVPGCDDQNENYNAGNVYWLAAAEPPNGEGWARMGPRTLEPSAGSPLGSYRRVEYIEEEFAYQEQVTSNRVGRNRWNDRGEQEININVPIFAADPAAVDAELLINYMGFANTSGARWHYVTLRDGSGGETALGSYNADSFVPSTFSTTLTGAQLSAQTVTVHVDRGASLRLNSYVDWLQLSYDALYRARFDTLRFHCGDAVGDQDIEVTGFTTADLGLIEITDPRNPAWIQLSGGNVQDDGGSWRLSLRVPQPDGRRTFYADAEMTSNGVPEFFYVFARVEQEDIDPAEVTEAPDLVVISHRNFLDVVPRWINHRQAMAGGDLAVHVVDVENVYDYYSGGLKSIVGIQRFVTHAIDQWGSWALQLIGDANENARELGTVSESPDWYNEVRDWVPTHLHVQNLGFPFPPELLFSDKWFATPAAGPNYPDDTGAPPEMYVGRLPCNTDGQLNAMIDKIIAFESFQPGQDWRRRGIFFADDAWSYGYENAYFDSTTFKQSELGFEESEELMAGWWADAGLDSVHAYLSDCLEPLTPPGARKRDTYEFQLFTHEYCWPHLVNQLNRGASIVHYQGHANDWTLAHEYFVLDRVNNRRDVWALNNASRPWIFFGMGCHISDWAQNLVTGSVTIAEPSLGEKLLIYPSGGAAATYGSSGFEYLGPNAEFSEVQMNRWVVEPPAMTVTGQVFPDRWLLGELSWASESDLLGLNYDVTRHRRMVAQYALLGDALMLVQTGYLGVYAELEDMGGQRLNEGDELRALDQSNVRTVALKAFHENGVEAYAEVEGPLDDYAQYMTEIIPYAPSRQHMTYQIALPILPMDHTVTFKVREDASPAGSAPAFTVTAKMPQTATFYLEGEPIEPENIPFEVDVPIDLTAVVDCPAWLDAAWEIQLTGHSLALDNVVIIRTDEHTLDLSFTATASSSKAGERSVVLAIDGYETVYTFREPTAAPGIGAIYAFPNPMGDQTRFVIQTDLPPALGWIRLYSVAGKQVASVRIRPGDFSGSNSAVIGWDGRDEAGDQLANGVYLYRIEINGSGGRATSDMQRLVMMR